jgi:hypothetical protein
VKTRREIETELVSLAATRRGRKKHLGIRDPGPYYGSVPVEYREDLDRAIEAEDTAEAVEQLIGLSFRIAGAQAEKELTGNGHSNDVDRGRLLKAMLGEQ